MEILSCPTMSTYCEPFPIPTELTNVILSSVDERTVALMEETCKKLQEIISGDDFWGHYYQLKGYSPLPRKFQALPVKIQYRIVRTLELYLEKILQQGVGKEPNFFITWLPPLIHLDAMNQHSLLTRLIKQYFVPSEHVDVLRWQEWRSQLDGLKSWDDDAQEILFESEELDLKKPENFLKYVQLQKSRERMDIVRALFEGLSFQYFSPGQQVTFEFAMYCEFGEYEKAIRIFFQTHDFSIFGSLLDDVFEKLSLEELGAIIKSVRENGIKDWQFQRGLGLLVSHYMNLHSVLQFLDLIQACSNGGEDERELIVSSARYSFCEMGRKELKTFITSVHLFDVSDEQKVTILTNIYLKKNSATILAGLKALLSKPDIDQASVQAIWKFYCETGFLHEAKALLPRVESDRRDEQILKQLTELTPEQIRKYYFRDKSDGEKYVPFFKRHRAWNVVCQYDDWLYLDRDEDVISQMIIDREYLRVVALLKDYNRRYGAALSEMYICGPTFPLLLFGCLYHLATLGEVKHALRWHQWLLAIRDFEEYPYLAVGDHLARAYYEVVQLIHE